MTNTETIITSCDMCGADITDIDILDGATVGGWDHPDFGAMPAECGPCVDDRMTPPWDRKR